MQPKCSQPKKKGGKSQGKLCHSHQQCGAAASGQLCRSLSGAEEGPQGVQAAAGGKDHGCLQGPAKAPRGVDTTGGCGAATQGLSATHGLSTPEMRVEDLPQHFRRSVGSSVTET